MLILTVVYNVLIFLDVKIENIEEFIKKFLSHMFMESLVYGNIDKPVSILKQLLLV